MEGAKNLQLGKLNRQRPRRRTPAVNQQRHRLPRRLPRQRQLQTLIQPLPHRRHTHPQRRRLLETHPVRNPYLDIRLGNYVLRERAVLPLHRIAAVHEAADPVADLERFRHPRRRNRFDRAGVVAADHGAGRGQVVDVFPVGRVQGYRVGFDEDVTRAQLGDGPVGDEFGVFRTLDHDGFLGGEWHF